MNQKEVLKDKIEKYSNILSWLWKTTAVFSLFLFCFIAYSERANIVFALSIQGFVEFERIFDFPIKILTVSFILFGLWLTVERMKQTDQQIESITSNNRFNNFYKHREEFLKKFKEFGFIKSIQNYSQKHMKNMVIPPDKKINIDLKIDDLASRFYEEFYYTKSNKFIDNFNEVAKNKINQLIKDITALPRNYKNEINFEKAKATILDNAINNIPGVITSITTYLASLDNVELEYGDFSVSDRNFFTKLNTIYWAAVIIQDVLIYEGTYSKEIKEYIFDYNVIRVEKGLYY